MTKRREISVFNIAFLDLLSGALGAVIILYIAVPKSKVKSDPIIEKVPEMKTVEDIEAKNKIIALEEQVKGLAKYNKKLEGKIDSLQDENEKLSDSISKTKPKEVKKLDSSEALLPVDVGFKFKGRYIVFLIDVSGSMFKEDRIGQVKAGLKMLITSMGEDFYIDVINFPDGITDNFRSLWGHMKQTTPENKSMVYGFLQNLRPFGATPTRTVLKHVLQNYPHTTDIVLLSDGAPTRPNSKSFDDIEDVLKEIALYNNSKQVQINAIGVGSDFISNKENPKYLFLRKLSQQHNGFFVGF